MAAKTARRDSRKQSICSSSSKRLSDGDLITRLEKARGTERALQRRIVCDLAEVERRRLYLPLGYGSLFEFCTDYLRYSRSSAGRRISAARCIARFPRMATMFRRGECDLTVLSTIAGVVTKENCAEIAAWLRGRSLREVEAFALQRQPARSIRDQVRQIYVMSVKTDTDTRMDAAPRNGASSPVVDAPHCTDKAPWNGAWPNASDAGMAELRGNAECTVHRTFTPSAGSKMAQLTDNKSLENRVVRAGSGGGSNAAARPPGTAPAEHVVVERKFKIQFAVEPEFMRDLERAKNLLSRKHPKGVGLEKLFGVLLKDYLDRYDPERRHKKRLQPGANKKERDTGKVGPGNTELPEGKKTRGEETTSGARGTGRGKSRRADNSCKKSPGTAKKRSAAARTRHIPQSVRDEVFARDGGRCTFISTNGKRCEETWNLEIDHIIPYAKGGDNSPDNLRLLCARHNRLEAERAYGTDHMKKFYRLE